MIQNLAEKTEQRTGVLLQILHSAFGSVQDDIITGSVQDDIITGSVQDDIITGSVQDDIITVSLSVPCIVRSAVRLSFPPAEGYPSV